MQWKTNSTWHRSHDHKEEFETMGFFSTSWQVSATWGRCVYENPLVAGVYENSCFCLGAKISAKRSMHCRDILCLMEDGRTFEVQYVMTLRYIQYIYIYINHDKSVPANTLCFWTAHLTSCLSNFKTSGLAVGGSMFGSSLSISSCRSPLQWDDLRWK